MDRLYTYYRLNIRKTIGTGWGNGFWLSDIKFYSKLNQDITSMVSFVNIIASETYGGSPWNTIDGSTGSSGSYWAAQTNETHGAWIQWQITPGIEVAQFQLTMHTSTYASPFAPIIFIDFFGSYDGSTWTKIYTIDNFSMREAGGTAKFIIDPNIEPETPNKIWNFEGRLQRYGKDVITEVESECFVVKESAAPKFHTTLNKGRLELSLQIPENPAVDKLGVGRQYKVGGSTTNPDGKPYGIIFNDYTNNNASGIYSSVFGHDNKGKYANQFVIGQWNNNQVDSIFEIGNGSSADTRKNIFRVTTKGDCYIEGDIYNKKGISLNGLDKDKVSEKDLLKYLRQADPALLTYTNPSDYIIQDNNVTICNIKYNTVDTTTPLFHATIPFELSEDGLVTFDFYLKDLILPDHSVTQYYHKGKNFATLFTWFPADAETVGEFIVKARTAASDTPSLESITRLLNESYGYDDLAEDPPVLAVPKMTIIHGTIHAVLYIQGLGYVTAKDRQAMLEDEIALKAKVPYMAKSRMVVEDSVQFEFFSKSVYNYSDEVSLKVKDIPTKIRV